MPGDPASRSCGSGLPKWDQTTCLPRDQLVLNTAGVSLLEQFINSYVTVTVDRTVWQIGQDAPPGTRPPTTFAEFPLPNSKVGCTAGSSDPST